MERRKYLATISATMSGVALAGCSSDGDDGSNDEDTPTESDGDDGSNDEDTPTEDDDGDGVSAGGSDEGSAEGQCDESVLNDDDSNSVRWEGFANGTTEIESIDLTLESYVDFPVSVTMTVFFYREQDDISPIHQVSRTVEIEGRGFRQIQITDTRSAGGWDADITELSCP